MPQNEKNTDSPVIAAIGKLADLGVINSPAYWMTHYSDVRFVDLLLVKSAAIITKKGTRCATVKDGVEALVAAGIINTPEYWLPQTGNIGELLKALGGAVKKGVTEQELRQRVCDTINAWVGATRGSAVHLEILKIYNEHKPLAVGYAVKVSDAYCATTTSAAFIKAGISEWTGTECGVERFIQLAKQKGIWVENDAYTPKIGDAIVYHWKDGDDYASTDNTGWGDHVGIVTQLGMGAFTVTEGNINGGKVGKRTIQVNGRYIRGFITPPYAAIAKKLSE